MTILRPQPKTRQRQTPNLSLTEHERRIVLPRPHPAQRRIITESRRFNVVDAGRRFGKTVLGVDRLVPAMLAGKPAAWFAPEYKFLREVWRDFVRILAPITVQRSEQEKRLELITGGVFECWSLDDPNAGRSRKYAEIVIDEAAMVKNLKDIWEQAIRPTLADYRGGAWFQSSPKGLNYFYELYQKGNPENPDRDPNWRSWKMPTSANPYIHPAEVADMAKDMPRLVRQQEIEAEFVELKGSLFNREWFRIEDRAPEGLRWVRYYDLAASQKTTADYLASIAGAMAPDGTLYFKNLIHGRYEWPDAYRIITDTMLAERATRHGVEKALHGIAAVQQLRRDPRLVGITFEGIDVDRDKISRSLPWQKRAEDHKVVFVRGNWINTALDEIVAFPEGQHDDIVDAISGCVQMLGTSSQGIYF